MPQYKDTGELLTSALAPLLSAMAEKKKRKEAGKEAGYNRALDLLAKTETAKRPALAQQLGYQDYIDPSAGRIDFLNLLGQSPDEVRSAEQAQQDEQFRILHQYQANKEQRDIERGSRERKKYEYDESMRPLLEELLRERIGAVKRSNVPKAGGVSAPHKMSFREFETVILPNDPMLQELDDRYQRYQKIMPKTESLSPILNAIAKRKKELYQQYFGGQNEIQSQDETLSEDDINDFIDELLK